MFPTRAELSHLGAAGSLALLRHLLRQEDSVVTEPLQPHERGNTGEETALSATVSIPGLLLEVRGPFLPSWGHRWLNPVLHLPRGSVSCLSPNPGPGGEDALGPSLCCPFIGHKQTN